MCFSAKQPGVSLSGWSCLFVCLRVKIVVVRFFFLLLGGLLMARELVEGADWRMVGARRSALI